MRSRQGYVLEEELKVLEEAARRVLEEEELIIVLEEFLTLIHIRGRQAGWIFQV